MSHRPQGTTVKASHSALFVFLHSLWQTCVVLQTGFSFLLSHFGVWVSVIILNIYVYLILCVFRRNTERETGP